MNVAEAITERFSCRAFLDKAVPEEVRLRLLTLAAQAPSGVNHQPWIVRQVPDSERAMITQAIIAARDAGTPENPDYPYYPKTWTQPYLTRRRACGHALYAALGIEKHDTEKRRAQWYRNYMFFGAPIALMFFIEEHLEVGSWMDTGMFIQTLMLAAKGMGLDTCAQASLAEYPDIVRSVLNIPDTWQVVCGMAIGYADMQDPINQYRTTRRDVSVLSTQSA